MHERTRRLVSGWIQELTDLRLRNKLLSCRLDSQPSVAPPQLEPAPAVQP